MVYGTRFEIGRGVILTEGSNPSFSANTPTQKIWVGVLAFKGRAENPLPTATGFDCRIRIREFSLFPRSANCRDGAKRSQSLLLRQHPNPENLGWGVGV